MFRFVNPFVPVDPAAPAPPMFTPSCLRIFRRISLIVTFKVTWSRPRIISEFTTLPAPPAAAPPAGAAPPELMKPVAMS